MVYGAFDKSFFLHKKHKMSKQNQQIKIKSISQLIGLTCIGLGIILLIIKSLLLEYVDAEGVLHEHFFLLPIGFFFFFVGILLMVLAKVISFFIN